jgi:hypothetical protein
LVDARISRLDAQRRLQGYQIEQARGSQKTIQMQEIIFGQARTAKPKRILTTCLFLAIFFGLPSPSGGPNFFLVLHLLVRNFFFGARVLLD